MIEKLTPKKNFYMSIKFIINNTSSAASSDECDKLEKDVKEKKGFSSTEDSKNAISLLCQAGGTNQAQGSLSVSLVNDSVTPSETKVLTLKEVKDCIKSGDLKITLRQYARARSQEIFEISTLAKF